MTSLRVALHASVLLLALESCSTASACPDVLADARSDTALVSLRLEPGVADLRFCQACAGPPPALQFTALLQYDDGGERPLRASDVLWASSDPSVATIDRDGRAAAVRAGSATITATRSPAGPSASAVLYIPHSDCVCALQVSPGRAFLQLGMSYQLNAIGWLGSVARPADAVEWTTLDPAVVSVDANGMIRGVAEGIAWITIHQGTLLSRAAEISVSRDPLRTISVGPGSAHLSQSARFGFALSATGATADGHQYDVTEQVDWTSSAPSIAVVSTDLWSRGRVIPSLTSTGNAEITARYQGVAAPPVLVAVDP